MMKIRIKGNSIRIRLLRPEVEQFGREGMLRENTEFGDAVFSYVLQNKKGGSELSASFAGNTITMYVPETMTDEWTNSDVTGYSGTMDAGEGKSLFLLLEKDFKCTDGEGLEDQSDNYDHPLLSCK